MNLLTSVFLPRCLWHESLEFLSKGFMTFDLCFWEFLVFVSQLPSFVFVLIQLTLASGITVKIVSLMYFQVCHVLMKGDIICCMIIFFVF